MRHIKVYFFVISLSLITLRGVFSQENPARVTILYDAFGKAVAEATTGKTELVFSLHAGHSGRKQFPLHEGIYESEVLEVMEII
jgi:hypothetical protein